jgi:hypothetical protein
MSHRPSHLRAALVLLCAYVLLTAAAFATSEVYVGAWLPVLRVEIDWLLPDGLHCESLEIVSRNAQRLIEMHVVTTHPMTFGKNVLPVGVALRSSTLQAYLLSHAVIVYAILLAWPVTHWRRRAALLILGIPCVLLTTSLDVPFVLSGLAENLILENLAPERADNNPLTLYYLFMHDGGRIGLAFAGAALTALLAIRARPSTAEPSASAAATDGDVNSSAQKRHRPAATAP